MFCPVKRERAFVIADCEACAWATGVNTLSDAVRCGSLEAVGKVGVAVLLFPVVSVKVVPYCQEKAHLGFPPTVSLKLVKYGMALFWSMSQLFALFEMETPDNAVDATLLPSTSIFKFVLSA